ncbi:unnamed protein product [Pleuronectes platessa]|uniref:Uncharacterized protein n=1 Tax=Pleuronectes platessa TaxID=8262 RepID=A0A9N7U7Z5_PLEPL|nr:unnamed protein product [Pleuronectes platessa]
MVSVQGRSGVSIDGPRREGQKKTETDPLVRPLVFIVIPLLIRQTDARACVNDSLSLRMSAGCRAACYSLQVKCLWRHMEQGKLTTRGNSPQQREVLLVSPPNKI